MKKLLPHLLVAFLLLSMGGVVVYAQGVSVTKLCPDGTPAPNNDSSQCINMNGTSYEYLCQDGSAAPNNSVSQCTCAQGNQAACTAGGTGGIGNGTTGSTGNGTPVVNSVGNGPGTSVAGTIPNPFNCGGAPSCTLDVLLNSIITNIVLPVGGVLAILAFIFSGFLYVTAQGNEEKIKQAHRALLYTAIGTAVLLGATIIAAVVGNTIKQL
jgi:hypothetical protein